MAGCGPRLVVVSGRVTDGQRPLAVGKNGQVAVFFTPVGAEGDMLDVSHSATVDPATGAYTLRGLSGKGIPPGQYHVMVRHYDPYPIADKLKGVFAVPSQLMCEVVEGRPVDVDVGEVRGRQPPR